MPSTVIRAYRYDAQRRLLEIVFVSGRRYVYREVPPEVYAEMRQALSKGVFFNRQIRDCFEHSRVA